VVSFIFRLRLCHLQQCASWRLAEFPTARAAGGAGKAATESAQGAVACGADASPNLGDGFKNIQANIIYI